MIVQLAILAATLFLNGSAALRAETPNMIEMTPRNIGRCTFTAGGVPGPCATSIYMEFPRHNWSAYVVIRRGHPKVAFVGEGKAFLADGEGTFAIDHLMIGEDADMVSAAGVCRYTLAGPNSPDIGRLECDARTSRGSIRFELVNARSTVIR